MPEANDSGLNVSDVEPLPSPPVDPAEGKPDEPAMPPPNPAPDLRPFVPLNPPPTIGHTLNTGLSTELGDSAKAAFEKINAGFAHVYSLLTGEVRAAEPVAAKVETIAKADFDAVVAKVEALEAALKNAASAPPVEAVEAVAKADFDALQTRFNALAKKLEVALGLEPAPPPPPA